jgi:NADH-quinone oxidoreductase subunit K
MSVGLSLILAASSALLAVGLFAIVARRNAVTTLLGTQFVFAAGAIAFVAFGRFGLGRAEQNAGAVMALFAGATAVAELTVGLAMALMIYRESRNFVIDADRG